MRALLAALAGALLCGACATADPPPPDRYYRLAGADAGRKVDWKVRIVVQPVEAHGVYSERPLLFRRGGAEAPLEQYHYHLWAEAPAQLLGDLLADHLRAVYGGTSVFSPGARVPPDLVIRPRLRALEQVQEPSLQARLALQFVVTDDLHAPLLALDFDESEPLGGPSPEEFAAGINRLAVRACAQLAEKLATLRS